MNAHPFFFSNPHYQTYATYRRAYERNYNANGGGSKVAQRQYRLMLDALRRFRANWGA